MIQLNASSAMIRLGKSAILPEGYMKRVLLLLAIAIAAAVPAQPFVEGFDNGPAGFNGSPGSIVTWGNGAATNMLFPSGTWVALNLSSPLGPTGWFNDNSVFPPFAGAGMINANANNGTLAGNVNNWLMTHQHKFTSTQTLSFRTRTITNHVFPARLVVRASFKNGSTNPADFTNVLLTINPSLTVPGYPTTWTQFSIPLVGVPVNVSSGRFAFQFLGSNGGIGGPDFIGIDDVRLQ